MLDDVLDQMPFENAWTLSMIKWIFIVDRKAITKIDTSTILTNQKPSTFLSS